MTEHPTPDQTTSEQHADWNDRLVRMANEIARNFTAIGHERAAVATADHIHSFWDRRMKEKLFQACETGECGLSPAAHAALQLLHDRGAPAHQTRATEDIPGASDAG
ncbi:hypothetical protein D3875_09960 [Deinococcus cavernae]|uniref:Formate dehydrogenase n=1 Tax=Deinococcus cavernae TaxID=2320857 RepID=A0A418V704_9DEIO|nr:formate dehydrogenase subunit delta [Deinococcus cavernae]RJF71835.1 hypothetical protein D3875_09960 [Deinococcus cavernae]